MGETPQGHPADSEATQTYQAVGKPERVLLDPLAEVPGDIFHRSEADLDGPKTELLDLAPEDMKLAPTREQPLPKREVAVSEAAELVRKPSFLSGVASKIFRGRRIFGRKRAEPKQITDEYDVSALYALDDKRIKH